LRLANGSGDLDDLVTLEITGAGLGAGGLPPGKKVDPNIPDGSLEKTDNLLGDSLSGIQGLPTNMRVQGLSDIPDQAINPAVLRPQLDRFIKASKVDRYSLAVASVTENGRTEHILAVSGKALKGNAPHTIDLNGKTYKVVTTDSGSVPSVANGPNSTNFNHAEQKLASYIRDNYSGRNASVSLGVQNTSINSPGMCLGCRQTIPDFASQNPNLQIDIFEGTTGVNQ